MSYFAGFGDYNNTTGIQPTSSNVVDGNSARVQNGDLYDRQIGSTTLVWNGDLNAIRKGYDNSLIEGCDFFTVLGASFGTVAGANTSTTGGGVVQAIAPFSIRTVAGWDVDIKVGIQSRLRLAPAYDYSTSETYRATTWKEYELSSETTAFANKVTRYCEGERNHQLIESSLVSAAEMISNCEKKVEEVFTETEYPVICGGSYEVFADTRIELMTTTGSGLFCQSGVLLVRGPKVFVTAERITLGE